MVRALTPPLPSCPLLSGQCSAGPPSAALGGSELPIMGAALMIEGGYLPVKIPGQALRDRWGEGKHKKELDGPSQPALSLDTHLCPQSLSPGGQISGHRGGLYEG